VPPRRPHNYEIMMIWLKKLVLPPSYPSKHDGWIKKSSLSSTKVLKEGCEVGRKNFK